MNVKECLFVCLSRRNRVTIWRDFLCGVMWRAGEKHRVPFTAGDYLIPMGRHVVIQPKKYF